MVFCQCGLFFVHVWLKNHGIMGIMVTQSTFGSNIKFL
jgi:hypothetical protein